MFNLSKHAQFADMVQDAGEAVETGLTEPEDVSLPQEEVVGDLGPNDEEKQRVLDLTSDQKLLEVLSNLQGKYPAEYEAVNSFLTNSNAFRQLQAELGGLPDLTEQYDMQAMAPQVETFSEHQLDEETVLNTLRRLNSIRREQERNQVPLAAFNLHRHKVAQMPPMQPEMPMQPEPQPQQEGDFPVSNEGEFITKFLDALLAFDNRPGTPNYERARKAAESIRSAVSPGFEEEANSIIESVLQLDENSRDQAASHLIKLYQVLIPPALKSDEVAQPMEPVMSQNNTDAVEGIVRFSLTDSVLNNKKSSEDGIVKTAADQFGQQYMLYGPTEKRICPKLRGKNMSVGDVVSEYTCRHHCIDGIVIDDNKTVCGEALWRANVMDKFSTEYVNADGEIEGGYLNKRFEINRDVPEENQRRLKPGETRKPRPAAWGSTESRLQDMRAKEGQSRDYRPETNTGDPFEWCHDVDQNNVEVSQEERNRREEAAGHQLVQHTNRDQSENNPKKAFNLKAHKTAQAVPLPSESPTVTLTPKPRKKNPRDTHQTAVNPAVAGLAGGADVDLEETSVDGGKPMEKKQSGFNLNRYKEARDSETMSSADIKDRNIKDAYIEEYVKPFVDSKKKT